MQLCSTAAALNYYNKNKLCLDDKNINVYLYFLIYNSIDVRAALKDDVEALKAWKVAQANLSMTDYNGKTALDLVSLARLYTGMTEL